MLRVPWIQFEDKNGVCPLHEGASGLLQALLVEFHLSRELGGFMLDVGFDGNTPAIRKREGKNYVASTMPGYPDSIARLQSEIDGVLFGSQRSYHHADTEFVFRFTSGGTLPILETDDLTYYCFFYRDVFPVGWNIANGASDSLSELLNPILTLERELREELLFFRLGQIPPISVELSWPSQHALPELAHTQAIVERHLSRRHCLQKAFQRDPLLVRWNPVGPDRIQIRYAEAPPSVHHGCYVSINAMDYGIEIDRVARMKLAPDMVVMDGELDGCYPLDRPVGLFEVEKTQAAVRRGISEFLPDLLFHTGRQVVPGPMSARALAEHVIEREYFERLRGIGVRKNAQIIMWQQAPRKFDLCPVTRQVLKRHMESTTPSQTLV